MIYNIVLTEKCDGHCRYCGGYECYTSLPLEVTYSVDDLASFVLKDPDPGKIVAFYGGEPLLRIGLMKEIMDSVPAASYVVQTNGKHLAEVPDDYLSRFSTVLVSVDGDERLTDYYRGAGTYAEVVRNVSEIKRRGYSGEVVARMAVSRKTDVYDAVTHLASRRDLFDGIHWQLDLQFGDPEPDDELDPWIDSYVMSLKRLVSWWTSKSVSGEFHRIYPFFPVVRDMLVRESFPGFEWGKVVPRRLRCGAGWKYVTVCTDGHLTACPVCGEFNEFDVGDVKSSDPTAVPEKKPGDPCPSCDVFDDCTGRCLFAAVLKPWGESGFEKVCRTVRALVTSLRDALPGIKKALDSRKVTPADFDFEPYTGAEIIP